MRKISNAADIINAIRENGVNISANTAATEEKVWSDCIKRAKRNGMKYAFVLYALDLPMIGICGVYAKERYAMNALFSDMLKSVFTSDEFIYEDEFTVFGYGYKYFSRVVEIFEIV